MDQRRRNLITALGAGSLTGGGIVMLDRQLRNDTSSDGEQQAAASDEPTATATEVATVRGGPSAKTTTAEPTTEQADVANASDSTTTEPAVDSTTEPATAEPAETAENATAEPTTTEKPPDASTTTSEPATTEPPTTTAEPTTTETTTETTTTTPPDPADNVQVSFTVLQNTAVPGTIYEFEVDNDNGYAVDVTVEGAWEWANGDTPTSSTTLTVGAYNVETGSVGTAAELKYETLVSHDAWVASITKA